MQLMDVPVENDVAVSTRANGAHIVTVKKGASHFIGGTEQLIQSILQTSTDQKPSIVLDLHQADPLAYGAAALIELHKGLKAKGISLVIAGMPAGIQKDFALKLPKKSPSFDVAAALGLKVVPTINEAFELLATQATSQQRS